MSAWRAGLLGFACAAAAACNQPDLDSPPHTWVGTGETEYVPLRGGESVDLVFGLQGGQHIWGSARLVGVDWREAELEFELLDEFGDRVSEPSHFAERMRPCSPRGEDACNAGVGETVGLPILVDDPYAVLGYEITVRLVATDGEGREADSEVTVIPAFSG